MNNDKQLNYGYPLSIILFISIVCFSLLCIAMMIGTNYIKNHEVEMERLGYKYNPPSDYALSHPKFLKEVYGKEKINTNE